MNYVPTKTLPGRKSVTPFCVDPAGKYAFLFDKQRPQNPFVPTDLQTGKQTSINTELPKRFNIEKCTSRHIAVNRSAKLFIYSSFTELDTKKHYFVSYSVAKDHINVIDEHWTGIEKAEESYYCFQLVKTNQICFIQYYFKESNTVFETVTAEIQENGKISSSVIGKKISLPGKWIHPFIQGGSCYWLKCNSPITSEQLFEVPLHNQSKAEIIHVKNKIVEKLKVSHMTSAQAIGQELFYYAYNKTKKFGMLVKLDLEDLCWRNVPMEVNTHRIIDNAELKQGKGSLYVQGNCCAEDCDSKTHICIIDLRYELQPSKKYAESAAATDIGVASAYLPQMSVENGSAASAKWIPTNYNREDAKEIGCGQFGVVYKCWDTERRRYFVAKHTHLQSDEQMVVAKNEIKRLKDLSHPRIVEYYGSQLDKKTMIIFMEYMPLGSIRQIIAEHGAISEKTTIVYTGQILEGLAYIHDRGIVHSDLKCDNLLSDDNGNVKIGDFGIAVQRILKGDQSVVNPKSVALGGGTRCWMAPEVFVEERVSRKSDVWSLGCTIIEMLTTKPPYSEMKSALFISALIQRSLSYDVKKFVSAGTSESMINFLTDLLQLDPAKRLKTGTEAADRFKKLFSI